MVRPIDPHPDRLVKDLQGIRHLDWSRPRDFEQLKTLLRHPVVRGLAEEPNETPQRVAALRAFLREVIARLEQRESAAPPPLERSVALAGAALLRLSPEFEQMPLEEIRAHIASRWEKRGGGPLSIDGFRLHLEESAVYGPLAAEFRELARERADDPHFDVALESALSPIAESLIAMEQRTFEERTAHIEQGVLKLLDERQMFEALIKSIEAARHEFIAVDHVDVSEWFVAPRLHDYLRIQLRLVEAGKIKGERIRIVTEDELEAHGRRREQLEMLIELHEKAGASLLLCRAETVPKLKLGFSPHVGLLVIDACTATPTAITGKLGDGTIGRAMVYLRRTDEVLEFMEEYTRLKMSAALQNQELRDQLDMSL